MNKLFALIGIAFLSTACTHVSTDHSAMQEKPACKCCKEMMKECCCKGMKSDGMDMGNTNGERPMCDKMHGKTTH